MIYYEKRQMGAAGSKIRGKVITPQIDWLIIDCVRITRRFAMPKFDSKTDLAVVQSFQCFSGKQKLTWS